MTLQPYNIDKSWTLFLDRDGVINQKRDNDYVKSWEEFIFLPKTKEAIAALSDIFGRIVIVTNQRGVGRKIMSELDLSIIHDNMRKEIEEAGGRIDKIYYCPSLEEEDVAGWRKPKPGMAFEAKKDFPEINFESSIVVGDSISDMEFGRNAGIQTVWISKHAVKNADKEKIDLRVESLYNFSTWIQSHIPANKLP